MKGFIEVNAVVGWNEDYATETLLISVENISCIGGGYNRIQLKRPISLEYRKKYRTLEEEEQERNKRYYFETVETYEEIKQKIKEATEPTLMVDKDGNLREIL